MRNIPVDTATLLANCAGVMSVRPVVDQDGIQRRTGDGVPKWSLFLAIDEPGGKPEIAEIKFNAANAPEIVPGAVPVIHGLTARYWEMGDRAGVSLIAQSVAFSASGANGSKAPATASA